MVDQAFLRRALEPLDLEATVLEAYAFLLARGSATATDLAQALRIQRTQAYRVGETMVQASLARQALERPVRYLAEPLDKVLGSLELEAALRLNRLHYLRRQLDEPPAPAGVSSTLEVIQGRPRAYQQVTRLVQRAQESIEILDLHARAERDLHQAGLLVTLQAKAQQGVEVRSLLSRPAGTGLPDPVRVLNEGPANVRWVLRDREEALLFVEVEDGRPFKRAADRAVWASAGQLVTTLGWFFDSMWENGTEQRRHESTSPRRSVL